MVPNTSTDTENVYDEYIATLGEDGNYYFEKIGSTEVDLTDYAKKEELSNKMDKFADVTIDESTGNVRLQFTNELILGCSHLRAPLDFSATHVYLLDDIGEDNQAVHKKYVDNLVGDINSVLATIVDGVE